MNVNFHVLSKISSYPRLNYMRKLDLSEFGYVIRIISIRLIVHFFFFRGEVPTFLIKYSESKKLNDLKLKSLVSLSHAWMNEEGGGGKELFVKYATVLK